MTSRSSAGRRGRGAKANPVQKTAKDSLAEYKHKRDFGKTPEPQSPPAASNRKELAYVIQRHDASHLHYDLRLEESGVLKSWAIPKLPPEVEGLKRLAVQTEDHPLDYQSFEGIIPEGEYGAGQVEIWDKGHYLALEKGPSKRLFTLQGRRLKGTYALIKLKAKNRKDKNWLFFKTRSTIEGR
jgi:DNA ligase D-like protein (predicted 3'-phosphoesterase)